MPPGSPLTQTLGLMSHRSQSIGSLSLVLGATAIPCVAVAEYNRSILHQGSWEVLKFAARHGLLAPPETSGAPAFKPPSLLMLNDFTATSLLLWFGIYLATAGLVIAIWSESRQEQCLYVAVGIVTCSMAIILCHATVGITALICTTLTVLGVRRINRLKLATRRQFGQAERMEPPGKHRVDEA
jgi:hypothetical protein